MPPCDPASVPAPVRGTAPAPAGSATRVVLFARAGCHLCDEARVLVTEVCAATGAAWTEVDVDAAPATGARPVPAEYDELVPVVEVDGVRQGYWRIDAQRLRRALAAPPQTPGD